MRVSAGRNERGEDENTSSKYTHGHCKPIVMFNFANCVIVLAMH